ncbi:MAG: hypothetical protein JNK56_24705 [Myxococcales bacterium]|nr:hypothetical protein [Myxococcales bacterium]
MAALRGLIPWVVTILLGVPGTASATNYTLWINGRGGTGVVGNYNSFTYWGPAASAAGVNPKSVNWDGYSSISAQNGKIRDALDCFCTGNNWCYIATHDAGDLMLGYTLANYGGSARMRKNAVANATGQCGNSDGNSQIGWNIKWVRVAGGAAGGSELSDYGTWPAAEPLVKDLKTTTARAMYDHNNTRSVWFYMYAAAKGTLFAELLPGQDDEVVSYHSAGGVAGASGTALGNPTDWFANDLTLGTVANEGGSGKWSFHSLSFRDDAEAYGHHTLGNWAGIVSLLRTAMATYAK